MKTNKVAPWEGRLVWVGTPRTGKSRNGNDWTSVDFVIEYTDEQGKERHVMFNLFGNEKVNQLFTYPVGTKLRVKWSPEARESNGRWWSQNSAYEVEEVDEKNEPAPKESPAFKPNEQTAQEEPDGDFPF